MLKTSKFKNIFIFADKTPKQHQYFNDIRKEMNERNANGEDLKIKLIHNIPHLVTAQVSGTPTSSSKTASRNSDHLN